MRFVCLELTPKEQKSLYLNELFATETGSKSDSKIDSDVNTQSYLMTLTPDDKKNAIHLFGRLPFHKKLLTVYPYYQDTAKRATGLFRTFSQLATDLGLTLATAMPTLQGDAGLNLITNLTSTEYGKKWAFVFHNIADIRSSYWYTVLSDDGLYLLKPARLSTSKQIIISDSDITSNLSKDATIFDASDFTGESGLTVGIDTEFDTCFPSAQDSDVKNIAVNKALSKNGIITFRSNTDAVPLDFVVYGGNTYVILSKKQLTEKMFEYIAVLEKSATNTFSGANQSPVIRPAMNSVDNWHIVGAAGEPAFASGWVNYDAANYQGLRFTRDDFGIVRYEGLIKFGATDTVTTFPAGYRPALNLFHTGSYYNGATINVCSIRITSAGVLTADRAAGANWAALSGWFFIGW